MFCKKTERKKHRFIAPLAIGMLAAFGACALVKSGRSFVCEKGSKLMCLFKRKAGEMKEEIEEL